MGHTFYGDLPGRFDGEGWDFFKRGWWLWLLAVSPFAVVAFIVGITGLVAHARADTKTQMPLSGGLSVWHWFIVLLYLSFPFIYAAFKAKEWKWWAEGVRFVQGQGSVRFESDLRRGALIANIWKMIGVGLLVSLAAAIISGIITFAVSLSQLVPISEIAGQHVLPVAVITILSYLGSFLALGVVWRIYMVQRTWKLVVSSIGIENLGAADHVVAKGEAASALGEGLADSLDVAGF